MIHGFLVLADSVSTDTSSGKVHMLGAGWSLTGPMVPPSAVAGFLRIPWDEAGRQVQFRLHLVDQDREPVKLLHDDGQSRAIVFEGALSLQNAQPADELSKNLPVNVSFGLSIPPLPLPAGQVYQWMFDIGETEVAAVQFAVRSQDVTVADEPHSGEPE
ncbi:hypothetical protein [Nonomuraea sp. NPDC049784]|uniref:DUF6941 family protein n=1 Tax=Nonomuraea sp. NPDC049784 TaxID=3154361 RepID=UPI0033CA3A1E